MSAWDRWAWPVTFTGVIVLGMVLYFTVEPPLWVRIALATGIAIIYSLVPWLVARRRERKQYKAQVQSAKRVRGAADHNLQRASIHPES
ncbi:hypothetical protein EGT50_13745 [Rhodococcus xishaensis]|uniref:Uncharacterized protein n=1 Tax=Rhodococcus xishaensis TaxID=2487364 RepID=A0A438ARF6_9NOCA|nr:hypothetical protein EGT50_13745 [Rhodococcus xishaensis]